MNKKRKKSYFPIFFNYMNLESEDIKITVQQYIVADAIAKHPYLLIRYL